MEPSLARAPAAVGITVLYRTACRHRGPFREPAFGTEANRWQSSQINCVNGAPSPIGTTEIGHGSTLDRGCTTTHALSTAPPIPNRACLRFAPCPSLPAGRRELAGSALQVHSPVSGSASCRAWLQGNFGSSTSSGRVRQQDSRTVHSAVYLLLLSVSRRRARDRHESRARVSAWCQVAPQKVEVAGRTGASVGMGGLHSSWMTTAHRHAASAASGAPSSGSTTVSAYSEQ